MTGRNGVDTTSSGRDATEDGLALGQELERRAGSYYPWLERSAWRATLVRAHRRPSARLYVYELGAANGVRQRVVAKVPRRAGIVAPDSQRPRLFPPTGPKQQGAPEALLEFRALVNIERAVRVTGDSRVGYVRALDHLPAFGALIMEHVDAAELTMVLRRSGPSPWARRRTRLAEAFHNAGVWLRLYRGLQVAAPAQRSSRTSLLEAAAAYIRHLGAQKVAGIDLRDVMALFERRVVATLPEVLPTGLAHTDFSPRNVFVGAEGQVTVIDTLGCWRTPTFEDPAYFLSSIQTAGIQVVSRGLAGRWTRIESLSSRFLEGAGLAGPDQLAALSTYRVLLLLDRWAAARERAGTGAVAGRSRDRFFAAELTKSLRRPEWA